MVVESVMSDPDDVGSDKDVPLVLTPPPQPDASAVIDNDISTKSALRQVLQYMLKPPFTVIRGCA